MPTVDKSLYEAFAPRQLSANILAPGNNETLADGNRTVIGSLASIRNEALVHIARRNLEDSSNQPPSKDLNQTIAIVKTVDAIPPTRAVFVNEAYGVFAALQAAVHAAMDSRTGGFGRAGGTSGHRRHMLGFDNSRGMDMSSGSGGRTQIKRAVLRASQEYRERIVAQFQQVESPNTPETFHENEVLRTAHSALQLLDLVHLKSDLPNEDDALPWDHVQPDYSAWLSAHYMEPRDEEFIPFKNSANQREHPLYWRFVYQTLLRGHLLTVVSILKIHPDYRAYCLEQLSRRSNTDTLVVRIIELVETMPIPSRFASQLQFEEQWALWKEDVERTKATASRHAATSRDSDEFDRMLSVLNGDERAIKQVANDWREAVSGLIIYVHPALKRHEVAELLSRVNVEVDPDSVKELVELSIIEGNFQRAIRYCSKQDWWLVSHLADLLHHIGALDSDNLIGSLSGMTGKRRSQPSQHAPQQQQQREWYLLGYAQDLVSDPAHWRIGLEYIAACCYSTTSATSASASCREVLDATVTRIPFDDSERKFKKLVAFARRHNLDSARKELHRTYARRKLAAGRIGEALEHYAEARDAPQVARIVDSLLDARAATMPVVDVEAGATEESFTASPSLSTAAWRDIAARVSPAAAEWHPRLALLVRYEQFYALYADPSPPSPAAAAAQLVRIINASFGTAAASGTDDITHRLLPKRLIITLLFDALPLLLRQSSGKDDTCLFGVAATNDLMRCLEDVTASHRSREYVGAWAASKTSNDGVGGGGGGGSGGRGSGGSEAVTDTAIEGVLAQLAVVRAALTKNLARAYILRIP
ncbi:hypothetical protein HDU87_006246 [Geranomyces variabilis]|uniref:Nuclear pore complex protein Nup85 n=1 Tax=Geranomyces variabilis TaxID=109894 RepID=A0AAD5TIB1_9FUNG|nr:hypothetical protein HDU87_006246 [Geranomyces variabilis]